MKKEQAREKLKNSQAYATMQRLAEIMDRFYVDAIVGMALPYGLGDVAMAAFSLVYIYFSLVVLHSLPLTLAIINNTLRDIAIGLVPFFIGDILDFFHKSNRQNMALIEGFVNGDRDTIHEVNTKAVQSVVMIIVLVIIITLLIRLYLLLAERAVSILSGIGNAIIGLF